MIKILKTPRFPKAVFKKNRTAMELALQEASGPLGETFERLETCEHGLTHSQARDRLHEYGANEVAHERAPKAIIQLYQAFKNPFVLVLMALVLISYFLDVRMAHTPADRDWTSIIIMGTMVLISGLLRFWQEFRSNKAAEKLKSLVSTTATVLRRPDNGQEAIPVEIPMRELVVGDIVLLHAGDMVPADVRLITSRELFISQAVLTGEALPMEKYDTLGSIKEKNAQINIALNPAKTGQQGLLDLSNLCFMGTNVASGSGSAVVVATGQDTYFGALAKNVTATKRIETSFDRGVASVSWLLIRFMLVMVPLVFAINGFTKGDWLTALTFSLAVAVGLTPEMLPMIVSANLAKGAIAMSRRKVIVKRLNSVQNLGAMDMLCTDKTGTITQDKITLDQSLNIAGLPDQQILHLGWLNSVNQSAQKNLMDIAIMEAAQQRLPADQHVSTWTLADELPFDFVRRRLSVVLSAKDGSQLLVAKGAVEEMLSVSTHHATHGGEIEPLDEEVRAKIMQQVERFNDEGLKVLLLATRSIHCSEVKDHYSTADENALTVHGFLTFLDRPKETAAEAIRKLQEYGVAVKVLTGDSANVAGKVCRDVGLDSGKPLLGTDIERMDDVALCAAAEKAVVFAKLTPLQKARVIKALQVNGHTVGFLGDGINDAPALRDADVGISVDTGTDIAKETADIILLEKSLLVLEEGVVKGRETFGNILKYLNMTASSNFGNVFSVLVASAWLPWEPMLALQLLIQNLIYDISQMTLPWDKMDADFLRKPRKWEAPNIRRFMIWLGPTSSVFDITTYILMWTVFGAGAAYAIGDTATNSGQMIMNSGWFIEGLVSQTMVVHMLRTRKIPFLQSVAAWPVLLSTSIAIGIACWLPFSPLSESLGFMHISLSYFPWLILTMAGYMALTQIVKTIYIRRYGRWY